MWNTIYAKILVHDEMQILLQIQLAIIIGEWVKRIKQAAAGTGEREKYLYDDNFNENDKNNNIYSNAVASSNGRIVFPVTDRDRTRSLWIIIEPGPRWQ